jgi:hypothetical protein
MLHVRICSAVLAVLDSSTGNPASATDASDRHGKGNQKHHIIHPN